MCGPHNALAFLLSSPETAGKDPSVMLISEDLRQENAMARDGNRQEVISLINSLLSVSNNSSTVSK